MLLQKFGFKLKFNHKKTAPEKSEAVLLKYLIKLKPHSLSTLQN